jgi:hypothetical protein
MNIYIYFLNALKLGMGVVLPTHSNVNKGQNLTSKLRTRLLMSLTLDTYTIYNIILPQFCKDFKYWLHLDSI